jgi:succinoglycan biosynthesis protein ExoV
MKLHYYRHPSNNFGDDLNPRLWQGLAPELFADEADGILFVGVGTLLNDNLPAAPRYVVFGSGVGYGRTLPLVTEAWRFYSVRGPLSAHALGLPDTMAVIDPAVLLRRQYALSRSNRTFSYAYMPHVNFARDSGNSLRAICADLGVQFIDPRRSVEEVIAAMAHADVLITEAMHGAILADALRLPWIPVRSHRSILSFKWQDWCASIQVAYEPTTLTTVWDYPGRPTLRWLKHHHLYPNPLRMLAMKRELSALIRTRKPILSDERLLEDRTQELERRLAQLRRDFHANTLFQPERLPQAVG